MSALSRLDALGICVVTSLVKVYKQLADMVGVNAYEELEPIKRIESIVNKWVAVSLPPPTVSPTWRGLFDVLNELGLGELGQDIDQYLSGESASVGRFVPTKE